LPLAIIETVASVTRSKSARDAFRHFDGLERLQAVRAINGATHSQKDSALDPRVWTPHASEADYNRWRLVITITMAAAQRRC